MTRGEIWLMLDPAVGSEIRKTRPCVVVSPAEMHDHLRTVLVAPMTTAGREAPFRIVRRSWWTESDSSTRVASPKDLFSPFLSSACLAAYARESMPLFCGMMVDEASREELPPPPP